MAAVALAAVLLLLGSSAPGGAQYARVHRRNHKRTTNNWSSALLSEAQYPQG